jgi:perosamine synthetase
MIPYGRQSISDEDIQAVVETLRSDYLTQGPRVEQFEKKLAEYCGASYAVVVSSGTAALHAAYAAVGLSDGDEVITSPMTFAATANPVLWQGAKPVFVDIENETGNIDVSLIEEKITSKTKAIAPIDYTGRPVDLDGILQIAKKHNLFVIEDACHAIGASYKNKKIGSISDLAVFSFHPVKNITTGEGGAILTNSEELYKKMKSFVVHGIHRTDFVKDSPGAWYHEMQELGMNYRLTDIQAALGISQLKRLDIFLQKRVHLVERYNEAFKDIEQLILPLLDTTDIKSAWHLYVIRLKGVLVQKRADIFAFLREKGIWVQVHYIPVYYHPYYESLGYDKGLCPNAEAFYEASISIPLFPDLTESEQDVVIKIIKEAIVKYTS